MDVERLGEVVADGSKRDRNRLKAARALAQSDDPRALGYLFKASKDPAGRPILRAAFLSSLDRSPRRAEVAAFATERLADANEDVKVRAAAARVLGGQKSAQHVVPLKQFLADPAPEVRLAVRDALLATGGPRVDRVSLFADTLGEREQPAGARGSAARALGGLNDRRATPVLLAALGEELTPLPAVETEADLFQRVASEKELVPVIAARALGELGDPAALSGLLAQVGHPEAEMRVAVFEALARMGRSEALPAARMALAEDTEQRVRRWAGVLLKKLKEPETLPDLRRALEEDPDPGVRLQAVQALAAMNDRESVDRIRTALEKEELKEVRAAMEQALATLSVNPTEKQD